MSRRFYRSLVVSVCAVACAAAATLPLWPPGLDVRTDDKNIDGRPDVWRVYDRHGQLVTKAVDTNFDGRSDVHEYYERGGLVRRESDRDFNDHIDLVQEFDADTHQTVRSVSDVDFDGSADLLVLFQSSQPVYSQWRSVALSGFSARPTTASHSGLVHQLAPLEDPFRADLAVSGLRLGTDIGDYVGLATSGGLPEGRRAVVSPVASSSNLSAAAGSNPLSVTVVPYSPRGPPVSHLLN